MANDGSFNVKEFCFVWRLEKLFYLFEHTNQVCSPIIRINSNSCIHFKLTLEDEKFLLSIKDDLNLKISLNNADVSFNGRPPNVFDLRFSRTKDANLPGWIFSCQSALTESKRKKLVNGDLKITCHLFLGEPILPVSENQSVQDIDFRKLSRDLGRLLECGSCSDLRLPASDGEFQVHKALLSVRSPELLTKMENDSSFLSVEEFSAPVLRVVLQYLYTGKVDQDDLVIPGGLLSAVDSLKLDRLKEKFCAFPNEVEVVTKVTQAQTTFTWPLSNVSSMNLQSPTVVKLSPWLCSSVSEQSQIELCLESIMLDDGVFINVSVRWRYEHPPARNSSVVSEISVVDIFGELQHSYKCEFLLDSLNDSSDWKVVFSIKKSILYRDSDILLPDDSLSLLFDFKTSTQNDSITRNAYPFDSFNEVTFGRDDMQQLCSDLNKLLVSTQHSDMTLRSGSKRFKVHKFILSARAPKLLEKIANCPLYEVKFLDIEENVLENLLKYIYTAEMPELSCGLAMKLYYAAYNYELTLLKRKCLDFVKKNLTF